MGCPSRLGVFYSSGKVTFRKMPPWVMPARDPQLQGKGGSQVLAFVSCFLVMTEMLLGSEVSQGNKPKANKQKRARLKSTFSSSECNLESSVRPPACARSHTRDC